MVFFRDCENLVASMISCRQLRMKAWYGEEDLNVGAQCSSEETLEVRTQRLGIMRLLLMA